MHCTRPYPFLLSAAELRIGTRRYDCTYENMILAGSYLFKGRCDYQPAQWANPDVACVLTFSFARDVYGIVVATGKDTKIRLKQKPTGKKSWSLQNR